MEASQKIRFDELITFLRIKAGEFNLLLTRDTLIEEDLGISGDDAIDLIVSFSKKFNVNINNFDFKKYFYDEPGVFNFQNRVIAPFTIGYLEKAIIAGRLDEDTINS